MEFLNSKKGLIVAGVIFGVLIAVLAAFGNPGNMALCAACFLRDVAGSLKLQTTGTVQYFRPEIVGLVVGPFIMALATREYRSTAGSSPMTRFVLGFIMMIGALVFLGCPLRMVIRMAAGDLNAYVGLVGFVLGVATGAVFLKMGFSLGREYDTKPMAGAVFPIILVVLLIISLTTTVLAVSESGPGSVHAPWAVSLLVALIVGALAQRVRLCFAGGIRNTILMRDYSLLIPLAGIFVVMLVYNIASGNFTFSFDGQKIAHAQHLWNILGLYAVGLAATLAGGCPLRQMVLAGQGSCDATVCVLGMIVGAAFAHNFGLAASAASAATADAAAVAGGPGTAGQIVLVCGIIVLLVIGFVNCARQRQGVPAAAAAKA